MKNSLKKRLFLLYVIDQNNGKREWEMFSEGTEEKIDRYLLGACLVGAFVLSATYLIGRWVG